MRRFFAILWLCLWASLACATDGLVALPPLTTHVTDLTATLGQQQRDALESSLVAVEQRKGTQIAVLLLPSTQPESIEQFGIRLAEAWKVGRKGVDDGVIVILAMADRQMRIEVGYGLEGALNDATAKRIISETMTPRFQHNDYFGGLQAGIAAITAVIDGEALPTPPGKGGAGRADADDSWVLGLIAAVFLASAARALLGLIGSFGAAGVAGFFAFSVFGGVIAALVAGLVAFLLSFIPLSILLRIGLSGISGGGRGGGFSGGGGGFGGGGASGRW